ncbi:esterase [uncultured Massilia sp.]|uniref:esterase n=1 Tax=uncultured Massilia sp. TaxID=169973 RepID=UPI0025EB9919|nr:esterase [uncultured Massilia sp.]
MASQPARAPQLVVLLHGVGGVPADMAPLGERIAAAHPHARIAAPPAAHAYDLGPRGHQWFSVDGITEENRPARIDAALPAFAATVRALQRAHGVKPERTVLAGFSQGAIMALAACARERLAGQVLAIAGRFAPLPARWESGAAVGLVHGRMDGIMPVAHSEQAARRLEALGVPVRLELVPRAVHMLSPPILEAALRAWHGMPPHG